MLSRLGPARDQAADRQLAWTLAGIAGALNAAGFYADNLYSSNMTGNVSAVADHVALADFGAAGIYLALVAIFISGAAVSGVLINAGRRRGFGGIYAFSVLAEAMLLTGVACADLWLHGDARGAILAYGPDMANRARFRAGDGVWAKSCSLNARPNAYVCHGRAWHGHPRGAAAFACQDLARSCLYFGILRCGTSWVAGSSPAMTYYRMYLFQYRL